MGSKIIDWRGSFAVLVTPFTEFGDIDERSYRHIINSVISDGCHGIIAAGSTGEFFLMTDAERKEIFSIASHQANGRVPVLAGTSATATNDVINLTKHAEKVGCDGIMLLPPIYIKVSTEELIEFYSQVSKESNLPIMLYNSPAVPNNLTPDIVQTLMSIDNVVAIKDSSGDLRQMSNLIRLCDDRLKIFVGEENLLLPAISIGAVGAVAMMPQVVGNMAVELYDASHSGNIEQARRLHHQMVRIYDIFGVGSGYVAIKESMKLLGKPGGFTRPPMMPFTNKQRSELTNIFQDVGLIP